MIKIKRKQIHANYNFIDYVTVTFTGRRKMIKSCGIR